MQKLAFMEYEAVIGLEVHSELLTESKLFCSCLNRFGAPPNSLTCPVCLGLPGVLPVINKKAVEFLLMVAKAVEGEVSSFSKFDRKNYFYPDMPKNYQISQYDLPLCRGGVLSLENNGEKKKIRIKRIHLEEDTGKSVHLGTIDQSLYTLEDYNRSGVPLLELVTEPDLASPQEAHSFLDRLKQLLLWLKVSDCKMEQGSLRCDANVSVRKAGQASLGTKTEVKNMNSFKSVESALSHEIERQINLLKAGKPVSQETRGWDERKLCTFSMRSKEEVQDYRYFPEPDLPPMAIEPEWLSGIEKLMPELPEQRKARFISRYQLPNETARFLTRSRYLSDFFEQTAALFSDPLPIANWLAGDISKYLNANNLELEETGFSPQNFAELLKMIAENTISGKIAKTLIEEMLRAGKSPSELVKAKGLLQISDSDSLRELVKKVMAASPDAVQKYKAGKQQSLGFLVGQVMKETGGRANPQLLDRLLKEELGPGE